MKKYALLVGVENYRDERIARLRFARADAITMAERLRDRCGFDQVRVLSEENGKGEPVLVNIVTALGDMAGELRQDDLFLFFFAGHGLEKDGHGYLLARDSVQAFPEHGSLSLELLRKTFACLGASKRILLLDACRNSPDAGRADAANCMSDVISRDIVAAARSQQAPGTTTALLSACRTGQRAYEWSAKGHGVFTHYLIEGLDGAAWTPAGLEFRELAHYAAGQVRHWAANTPGLPVLQEPWYEEFGNPEPVLLAPGQPDTVSHATQAPKTPPPLKPLASMKHSATWWVVVDEQERGPLDDLAVKELVREGKITRNTECWRNGMDGWQAIGEVQEWAAAFPPPNASTTARPPTRRRSIHLPEFLEPVPNAAYAPLGGLAAGSEDAQKRQRQWVEKGYPLEVRLKGADILFRLVPPGEFLMGSADDDSDALSNERPRHRVYRTSPLYVAKFPVTQRQWQTVMGKNPAHFQKGRVLQERRVRRQFLIWGKEIVEQEEVRGYAEGDEHPVETVSWKECQQFLACLDEHLGIQHGSRVRLLTEAEWEYACRAGTTDSRYGSLDRIGWYGDNSGGSTHPVGGKRANAWGLHDMIGSVWEWCGDWHDSEYYANSPENEPQGLASGSDRVHRGGSWANGATSCRSAGRSRHAPDYRSFSLGFRLALVPAG